jgi:hypothetical protein
MGISEKQYTFMIASIGVLVVLSVFLILSDLIYFNPTGQVSKNTEEGRECFIGTCSLYYRCGEAGNLERNTCSVDKFEGFCEPIKPQNNCVLSEEVCNTKKIEC